MSNPNDSLKAYEDLIETFNPDTASDTEKINALLTMLNAVNDVKEKVFLTPSPKDAFIELASTTLDAVEFIIGRNPIPSPSPFAS